MKKLEEIPRKKVFEVPHGYFEKLPAIIQSRVASQPKQSLPAFSVGLRLAIPLLVMAISVIFWLSRPNVKDSPENILASMQTKDLIDYLAEADLTTDELLEHVDLDAEDVSQIEDSVYQFQLKDSYLDGMLNEMDK
jgi:hypothetical protein